MQRWRSPWGCTVPWTASSHAVVLPLDDTLGYQSLAVQLSLDEAVQPLRASSGELQAVLLMDEVGAAFFGGRHPLVSSTS